MAQTYDGSNVPTIIKCQGFMWQDYIARVNEMTRVFRWTCTWLYGRFISYLNVYIWKSLHMWVENGFFFKTFIWSIWKYEVLMIKWYGTLQVLYIFSLKAFNIVMFQFLNMFSMHFGFTFVSKFPYFLDSL